MKKFWLLFFIALLPRLFGLDLFITSDENTNIFLAGSKVITAFWQGNFRGTYWHFYPGVTMSWLDACGMAGQYLGEWFSGHTLPPFTEYIYGDIRSLLVANRLPYAMLTAAAVPTVYLLARRLLPDQVALLGAFFLAFDPFFLAHSRVTHGDAPVAVFMTCSVLALYIHLEEQRADLAQISFGGKKWLILSAICGSLAALTKAPGQFMAPFAIGLIFIYRSATALAVAATSKDVALLRFLKTDKVGIFDSVLWGLVALATFILLWPSMWVDPVGTLQQMLAETFSKVDEGHLIYFFGQSSLDPGLWFYPYVIPFRLTPITTFGSILAFIMLFKKSSTPAVRLLWLFTLTLFLFGDLSHKKQDRYLLPLFPFIDLLAAIGWYGLFDWLRHFNKQQALTAYSLLLTPYLLLLLHLMPTITMYPYYLAYFNPLMGGTPRAAETTLMGWGEGMEQAAAYLNGKANAPQLYVAATPSQTFLPYFVGTGENFYTNDIAFRADYVIIYLAQRQRLAPSPEIVRYFLAQTPEKVITIQGVPYVNIYPHERRILSDIPPTATPINIGLDNMMRLAGYTIKNQPSKNPLTLYWHALSPLDRNYTISVRALAPNGQRLAQHDSWPLNGLLPTSQWRVGDYVADTPDLAIPTDGAISHFEIVVYQADTGATLGPPIVLEY